MKSKIENTKSAVVIGGTSGYGRGIADQLENAGWLVFRAGRSAQEDRRLDVRFPMTVAGFFHKLGFAPDLVVYSAGIAEGKAHVADVEAPRKFSAVMDTNATGLLYVARCAFPLLKQTKGWFVHIGSIASTLNYAGAADYCASKAAASTICRTLREEWLGTGVSITSIEPGLGDTSFQARRYNGDMEKAAKHYEGIEQLRYDDLGRVVLALAALPKRVHVDEIVVKPIDQVTHGKTIRNLK